MLRLLYILSKIFLGNDVLERSLNHLTYE